MIKVVARPKLKKPIVIVGWPGMGEVAYRSVLFLKEVMGFKLFAKLQADEFFKPSAIIVEKGIVELPSIPAGFFYYLKRKEGPDIILFLGEAQPALEYAEIISYAIIDFIKQYRPEFLLSFAARPSSIDHKADPGVWVTATNQEQLLKFKNVGLKVLEEGQISGLNGIILGVAKRRALKGVCLLGEIPFYSVQIENPRATAKVLTVLNGMFNLHLNMTPLMQRAQFIEDEIDKLVNYLKGETGQQPGQHSPLNDEDIDRIKKELAAYTKLPQSAREKIEKLFQEAHKDVAKASALKEELDRWNVYKEYEDRFLDIFNDKESGGESH